MLCRRISLSLLALSVCFSLVGCGSASASKETTTRETTAPKPSAFQASAPQSAAPAEEVKFIGERYVQYDEQNDVYEVMFALMDGSKNYVGASGTAKIKISDAQGNSIYKKSIKFTKADFTEWTNKVRDQSTYACWLTIPRSDVKGASSSSGTLSLSVYGNGYSFDEENLRISDLPQKRASIVLPKTPISIADMRFHSQTSYATVSDISYEAKNNYNGEMMLTLKLIVSLDSKEGRENVADRVAIAYKLVDSEGFVTATGTILTGNLRVGEKTKVSQKVYNLNPSETYTLTLEDVA